MKPGNILVSKDLLQIKLADFGLCKETSNTETAFTSKLVGTIQYMAPEIYNEDKCSEKVDMYSFAVIMYVLITGKPAYQPGTTIPQVSFPLHSWLTL